MICSQCGQPVPDGATFCSTCGHPSGLGSANLAGLPVQAISGAPLAVPEKTSGMAIASLIFGILFLFFPLNIVAIVLGHISLSQIKKSAGKIGGRGMAIAGLVLGYLGIAMIPLVLIIAAIAIPNLLRARMAANESSAAQSIRIINNAQVSYQATYPTVGFAPDLQSLDGGSSCTTLSSTRACLIDDNFALAATPPGLHGYIFAMARSTNASQYVVSAVPEQRHQTGTRSFCSTEDGVVRFDPNGDPITDHETCAELSPVK